MLQKIKNKLFDKMWKKSLIVFVIIFLIVFSAGVASINYLNDVVSNSNIHQEMVTVSNTMYSDNPISQDHFIIVGTNNKTYSIVYSEQKMFDEIEIGKTYFFTVKEPKPTDIHQYSRILQVQNVTN